MRSRLWRTRRDARWLVRWASHCTRLLRRLVASPTAPDQDVRLAWQQAHRARRLLERGAP